jgi:flagellar protein FliT
MSPYDALANIAERELELVRAGAVDKLSALHAQRSAIVATLPAAPPATAKPALERAAALHASVIAALEERMRTTGAELRRLSQGRTAMRGYTPPVEPRKLVDQAG